MTTNLLRFGPTCLLAVVGLALVPCPLLGQVTFQVRIEDPRGEVRGREAAVRANLLAAAELWGAALDGTASIEILFRVDREANAGRGSGASRTVGRVGTFGKNIIYEQGMAAEIRTGKDLNGNEPDVQVVLHPDYLATLWFDPEPRKRTAPVPPNRLDAVTVFLHELGHALAFNGWLDPTTGELKGEAMSTYDRLVLHDGSEFYFVGLKAMKLYGGPVPLSRIHNNYHHVGRSKSGPGAELANDLMNGIVFSYGKRYSISPLDRAILADTGVPVKD